MVLFLHVLKCAKCFNQTRRKTHTHASTVKQSQNFPIDVYYLSHKRELSMALLVNLRASIANDVIIVQQIPKLPHSMCLHMFICICGRVEGCYVYHVTIKFTACHKCTTDRLNGSCKHPDWGIRKPKPHPSPLTNTYTYTTHRPTMLTAISVLPLPHSGH